LGDWSVSFTATDGIFTVDETITITIINLITSADSELHVGLQLDAQVETGVTSQKNPQIRNAIKVAINQLNSIIHYIEAQSGKHISEYAADLLISALTDIIDSLQQL